MTGPHPLPPEDERALKATRENAMGATFQAMAEAMRANAEALHKIDSSQRQMADSLRKNEKVTQVVTSTKALNETFRGLSEIQRGLLETLVRDRGGRASGTSAWAFVVIAVLSGLLAVLVWERMTDDGRLPRELYEEARRRSTELSAQLAAATVREKEVEERLRGADEERNELRIARSKDASELQRLQDELERNKAQMKNYLQAKEQADAAGAVMLANEQLQREVGDLRRQLERLRTENETLWKKMADGVMEGRLGDPEAILRRAREQGVIEEEPVRKTTGERTPRDLTLIRRKIKRLLEGAAGDQGYELLMLKGVESGSTLTDVEVGRYEKHLTVGSIVCRKLEIRVDVEKDAVELRFRDGHIANLNKPNEKIPLDPDGHSVFIQGVGVRNWLKWAGPAVSVEPGGLLRWN